MNLARKPPPPPPPPLSLLLPSALLLAAPAAGAPPWAPSPLPPAVGVAGASGPSCSAKSRFMAATRRQALTTPAGAGSRRKRAADRP